MRKLSVVSAGAVALGVSAAARAQGFAVYVATPVAPPAGFVWVAPASVALLVGLNLVLLWRLGLAAPTRAAVVAVLGVLTFASVFDVFGYVAATATAAPPPGLGPPSGVYWGMGWRKAGWLFVPWNVAGCGFLLAWLLFWLRFGEVIRRPLLLGVAVLALAATVGLSLFGGPSCVFIVCALLIGSAFTSEGRKVLWAPRTRIVVAANAAAYLLCLAPYVATGALVHGWAGSHVRSACVRRVTELSKALARYANDHDGTLPTAGDMDELLGRLRPYIQDGAAGRSSPTHVCPVAEAFLKDPKPFVWNKELSGRRTREVDLWRKGAFLITCPYCNAPIYGRYEFREYLLPQYRHGGG